MRRHKAVTAIQANLGVFVGIRSMSWCESSGLVPPITLVLICNIQVSFSKSITLRKRKEDLKLLNTPLTNCFGFVDGTVLCICRPTVNQRVFFLQWSQTSTWYKIPECCTAK